MRYRMIRVSKPMFKPTHEFTTALRRNLNDSMTRIQRRQMLFRNSVTSTWEGDRPNWVTHKNLGGLIMRMSIGFGGWGVPKSGNRKWLWLSEGTEVRFAAMTGDFQAKTAHRELVSGVGRGGLWYVGKRRLAGIDPRYFDNEIMVRTGPSTEKDVILGVTKAFRET